MTDFDAIPEDWKPSKETLERASKAALLDPDLHLGGAKEEALGKQWLDEQAARIEQQIERVKFVRKVSVSLKDLAQQAQAIQPVSKEGQILQGLTRVLSEAASAEDLSKSVG